MSKQEEVKSELIQIGGVLFSKFGPDSYTERCRLNDVIAKVESLTSSHREEIEKAYKAGEGDGAMVAMFPSTDNPPLVKFKSATDYYEKTFGK